MDVESLKRLSALAFAKMALTILTMMASAMSMMFVMGSTTLCSARRATTVTPLLSMTCTLAAMNAKGICLSGSTSYRPTRYGFIPIQLRNGLRSTLDRYEMVKLKSLISAGELS